MARLVLSHDRAPVTSSAAFSTYRTEIDGASVSTRQLSPRLDHREGSLQLSSIALLVAHGDGQFSARQLSDSLGEPQFPDARIHLLEPRGDVLAAAHAVDGEICLHLKGF